MSSSTPLSRRRDFMQAVRGYPRTAFLICLCGVSLENMDQALYQYVFPQLLTHFGWTPQQAGLYSAIVFTIAGASIAALGVLTDRVGRKRVFMLSMIVGSFFVATMFWARTTWQVLTLRTLGFATGGIQSPVTGTIVVEEAPPKYRGLLSGILQIGYPLGWALASLACLAVIKLVGQDAWLAGAWRYAFFISLLSIPYFLLIAKYLRETKAFEAAQSAIRHPPSAIQAPRFKELFGPQLRFKTAMLFLGEFFHVFAYGTTLWLNLYFQKARLWQPKDAIAIVGLSYAVGSLGYIVSAYVGEFLLKRRNVIIIWAQLGALSFAVMIWLAHSWWAVLISYCLMTFFFYGTTAVKFTFIAENFPTRLRATGVTFAGSLAVNLGVAYGPLALGFAVERLGWNWAYSICGIASIFVSGLFFLALPAEIHELD
ncbi:MAG: MFS transporter [Acidobacteria bacterium]|nr:MFS transporter [Acidobacteriota bacterium]MBI3422252.1 MFS transporter [Acidobacteriota bacterium]